MLISGLTLRGHRLWYSGQSSCYNHSPRRRSRWEKEKCEKSENIQKQPTSNLHSEEKGPRKKREKTTKFKLKDYKQYRQAQGNCYLIVRTPETSTMMQNMRSQVDVTTILRTCLSEGQHTEISSIQTYHLRGMGIIYFTRGIMEIKYTRIY